MLEGSFFDGAGERLEASFADGTSDEIPFVWVTGKALSRIIRALKK